MSAPKWTDLIGIDPTYGRSEGDQHDADIAHLTAERDRARAIAVALEQELAEMRAGVLAAFDPGELECGRLGLACRSVSPRDRWCRACRLNAALDIDEEANHA